MGEKLVEGEKGLNDMPQSATKFLEEHLLLTMSRVAASAVTARRFVKLNAADHTKCDPATANDPVFGVALNDAAIGEQVVIAVKGQTYLDAGGAIALEDEIVSDANGKAVARGVTATVLYKVAGKAITQAANNEQVSVDLSKYNVWGANAS